MPRIAIFALLALAAATAAAEPAKRRFGAVDGPAPGPARVHGAHAGGCIAGAAALPEIGPAWRAMRPSRNRVWGHPSLIAFVERLGSQAQALGWPGVHVGDLSQPRGGPMTSGHSSHQSGLDVDIWMRRPDPEPLDRAARDRIGSVNVVSADRRDVGRAFTETHARLMRAAAEDAAVARIFVNAAVKKALCARDWDDRAWLRKIRPWWGHDHHFHVRLGCPAGSEGCVDQAPPPPGDGCDASLDWWFTEEALNPPPRDPDMRSPRDLTLAELPPACREVVETN